MNHLIGSMRVVDVSRLLTDTEVPSFQDQASAASATDPTSGGLLKVTDGIHLAKLELQGQYTVARHGKLPPRRHEELPPPWLAEERANARGANHGKPIVE